MDTIFINQLQLNTIIGIHAHEREHEQPIILDIEIGCCIANAVKSDNIKHCVDYFSVCERIKQLAKNHHYQLVESFAEAVSQLIINDFTAQHVRVKLSKPKAINNAEGVGVIIERSKMTKHLVYVGIGSNIDPDKNIRRAVQSLQEAFAEHGQLDLSPVYKTQAIGFAGDDFLNLVACFSTDLSAFEVEKTLKSIEHKNGRRKGQEKFSARTLDIDLLLYDLDIIAISGINVPRDEIQKYAFVLSPLADLAPDLIHPHTQQTISEMWQQMKSKEQAKLLQKINFSWS